MNIKDKITVNPVLRNESRLSVRSPRFSIMIMVYTLIITLIALTLFYFNNKNAFVSGIVLKETIYLYLAIACIQALLLMFIVPSLTSTAICSEREKQTLDILLASKLTPLQIVLGKLISSCSKVIILIICTLPVYSISFLIGGVNLGNVLMLCLFFIVTTLFVGSIGIFISSIAKTSKGATAATYATILILFIGSFVVFYISATIQSRAGINFTKVDLPLYMYINPLSGFISLLSQQVGFASNQMMMSGGMLTYFMDSFFQIVNIEDNTYWVSMIVQMIISGGLIYAASYILNPLKRRKLKK